MEWTRLRAMFDKNVRLIRHKSVRGRKLAHKTYAFLYNQDQSDPFDGKNDERIEIEFFEKVILRFYPDNTFSGDNHGYWTSQCTKDRFRSYLPWNGHLSTWRFDAYERLWQTKPNARRVWTVWMSGCGSHPWKNNEYFDINGHRRDLSSALNETNANELCQAIQLYADTAVNELIAGDLSKDDVCHECCDLVNALDEAIDKMEDPKGPLRFAIQNHTLRHVLDRVPSFPLLVRAAEDVGNRETALAAILMAKENQVVWRPARNNTQRAESIQRRMLEPDITAEALGTNPVRYKKSLRWRVEEHLLISFGFEVGE